MRELEAGGPERTASLRERWVWLLNTSFQYTEHVYVKMLNVCDSSFNTVAITDTHTAQGIASCANYRKYPHLMMYLQTCKKSVCAVSTVCTQVFGTVETRQGLLMAVSMENKARGLYIWWD